MARFDLGLQNQSVGGLVGSGTVINNTTGTCTLTVTTGTNAFSGPINNGTSTGTLALAVSGGIETLSNTSSTFSGGTTLTGGELSISALTNAGTGNITFSGGVLQVTGTALTTIDARIASPTTFNGGFDIANAANAFTVNIALSGSGSFSKSGAGKLTLGSTSNAYAGTTTVTGGILSIAADTNLGTAPGTPTAGKIVLNGGALSTSAAFTLNVNRGIALGPASGSGSGTIDVSGASLTYNGIITDNGAGAGGLAKTGTGSLILGGISTYTGGTTINSVGTLQLGAAGNLGTGGLTFTAAGTFDLNGRGQSITTLNSAAGGVITNTTSATTSTLTITGVGGSFNGVIQKRSGHHGSDPVRRCD